MSNANEAELTNESPKAIVMPKPRDRPALSAFRHGLTGQIVLMTQADQIAYTKHCEGYRQSLTPVGDLETDLVQAIADDRWRLKRAAALESAIFAAEIGQPDDVASGNDEVDTSLAMGRAWVEKGGSLQTLTLYESRIQRRFEKNLEILHKLQEKRAHDTEQVVREYGELATLAARNEESFDGDDFPREALPAGFVFSPARIEAILTHRYRLA
jgi:hypothetical protein